MKKIYWLCLLVLFAHILPAQNTPVAVNDTLTIIQFGTVNINALANDTNRNAGDTLCIGSVWGAPAGWATIHSCDSIVFHALDSSFTGRDTFYYQVCDRHIPSFCDTASVIIHIKRLVPLALNDTVTVLQWDTLVISPLANDTNYHAGDSLCLKSIYGNPNTIGWSTLQGCNHIIFRPGDSSYVGLDTIYYKVCDLYMLSLCDTAMIVVNIKRIVPLAVTDSVTLSQPGSVTIHALANDTNYRAGDTLCIKALIDTVAGWATVQGCGDIIYHPLNNNYEGLDTFYYIACDVRDTALCDTGMVLVNVLPLATTASFIHLDSMCGITLISQSTHADLLTWEVLGLNSGLDLSFDYEDTIVLDWVTGFVPDQYSVCLTSYNGTNTSTVCDTVSYGCVGIHEIAANDMRLYPNPATDQIRVDLSRMDASIVSNMTAIEVYDLIGTRLKTTAVSSSLTINVADLSNGIYVIASSDQNNAKKVLGKFEVIR